MKRISFALAAAWFFLSLVGPQTLQAGETHVAVASNFADAALEIAQAFEAKRGHKVHLSFGSTGKHYAQIKNGAPFAAFLAADMKRPLLLEREGRALKGSVFVYAQGRLALWSPRPGFVDEQGAVLSQGEFHHLSLANPKLAPYGAAAVQALQKKGLWSTLEPKVVRGENIAQTFQFVFSGNAQLGFVALSQVKNLKQNQGNEPSGSFWVVPQELHDPIQQGAALLKEDPVARSFLKFLQESPEARRVLARYGYDAP
ncbi:MAG: molybdate ABC transporter substrate-binding protein [bacterium]|nr:molybdate ABC transporter substrate-binding protein [bacterium]